MNYKSRPCNLYGQKNILPIDLNSDICDIRQSIYYETSFIKTAAQIDLGFKGENTIDHRFNRFDFLGYSYLCYCCRT